MRISVDIDQAWLNTWIRDAPIGYWASELDRQESDGRWFVRVRVDMGTPEGGKLYALDIERGVTLMLLHGWRMSPRLADGHDADAFVQYAAFGEWLFG